MGGPCLSITIALFVIVPLVLSTTEVKVPGKVPSEHETRILASKLHSIYSQAVEKDDDLAQTLGSILDTLSHSISPEFTRDLKDHIEEKFFMLNNETSQCAKDVLQFMDDLLERQNHTLLVIDATGKIASGVSRGNTVWYGSYDLCKSIIAYHNATTKDSVKFQGQYCMASLGGPLMPAYFVLTGGVRIGICPPDSCTPEDLNPIFHIGLEFILKALNVNETLIPATLKSSGISCATPAPWTSKDTLAVVIFSIILFLVMIGTLYDVIKRIQKSLSESGVGKVYVVNKDSEDEPTESPEADLLDNAVSPHGTLPIHTQSPKSPKREAIKGVCHSLLIGFSFITNGEKLLGGKMKEGQLGAVNGIRVLSMFWVILGHTYVFTVMGFTKNIVDLLDIVKRFSFQAIANATYSVDTFFFLSGLLVCYLLLRELRRNDGKMPFVDWVLLYVHRYIRLTPTLMFVILFYSTLGLHLPDGPNMRAIDGGAKSCYKYWWTNLLYINNFVPKELGNECLGWAWYLANDMQFFLLAPIIVFLLYRFKYVGYVVISCLILICLVSTGVIARQDNYDVNILSGKAAASFQDTYVRPWFRISPYLVGMICGYLVHVWETKGRPKLYTSVVIIGWCMAIAINMSVLYGVYGPMHYGYSWSPAVNAFYAATSRFAWSIGLAWLTFACITGYGGPINTFLSWSVWAPLGRLTYCAYLVHPIIIFNYIVSRRENIYVSDYTMIYFYIGHLVIAYLTAFVVSLIIEAPTMAVERVIFKRKQA